MRTSLVVSDRNPMNLIISTSGTTRFKGLNDIRYSGLALL